MEKISKEKAPKMTPEEKAAAKAAKDAAKQEQVAAKKATKEAAKAEKAQAEKGPKIPKAAKTAKAEKAPKEKKPFKLPNLKKEQTAKDVAAGSKEKKGFDIGLPIRVQLIIGFAIPVIFCIIIGLSAYNKASEGLIGNYEEASITALEMTMNSMDASMDTVASIVMELSNDKTVKAYSLGGYSNDSARESEAKGTIRENLNVKAVSTDMIEDVHVIPIGDVIICTSHTLDGDNDMESFMGELIESEDAYLLDDKKIHWYTSHSFIDTKLGTDAYSLFCCRVINSGSLNALVIVDVSTESILELLGKLDFGEGSFVSFITAEGAEVTPNEGFTYASVEGIDWGEPAEGEEVEEGVVSTTGYTKYNGETYFYMTVKSEITGGKMLALVPKEHITQSSDGIRNLTIPLVILACVIAVGLGCVIILLIGINIKKSVDGLNKVSEGDLTADTKNTKVPKNEFGKLIKALNNTIVKMRGLIGTVSDMKDAVLESGGLVMDSGIELGTMTENVSAQIVEINGIIATQNEAIADCNSQMEDLSVQIKNVSDGLFATIGEAANSRKMIDEGMATVEEMVSQSSQTADATKEVQEQVVRLAEKLGQITRFVNDIQEIASQTNLLSLNASIEAARAGEQGRGFSVVAEEIRKLADNSGQTATEINKIIDEITAYSQNALKKVGEAGSISANQMESAKKTITAFEQMNSLMEGLVDNMQGISKDVDQMNTGRHEALKAIRGIGESSEHTVQATSEVNRFLEKQMESSESLKLETVKMQENMKQLEEAIQTFKL
uniref:methyl-accepting chemotaxis protein n=1 Tax=Acetatifactor sp. TaxID=1872090 RepID=UPI004055D107